MVLMQICRVGGGFECIWCSLLLLAIGEEVFVLHALCMRNCYNCGSVVSLGNTVLLCSVAALV